MNKSMWRPNDVLVAIGFTSTKTSTFLVAHELAMNTQDGLWLKLTLY
jgi:hypothetical protein